MKKAILFLSVAFLLLMILSSTAYSQSITGCVKQSKGSIYNVQFGTVPSGFCHAGDKVITWQQEGIQGPVGPQGLKGNPGEPGPPGADGQDGADAGGPKLIAVDANGNTVGEFISQISRACNSFAILVKLNFANQEIQVCLDANILTSTDGQPGPGPFGLTHLIQSSRFIGGASLIGFDGPNCTGNAFWLLEIPTPIDPKLLNSFLGFGLVDYNGVFYSQDAITQLWSEPIIYVVNNPTVTTVVPQSIFHSFQNTCDSSFGQSFEGFPMDVLDNNLFSTHPLPYTIIEQP